MLMIKKLKTYLMSWELFCTLKHTCSYTWIHILRIDRKDGANIYLVCHIAVLKQCKCSMDNWNTVFLWIIRIWLYCVIGEFICIFIHLFPLVNQCCALWGPPWLTWSLARPAVYGAHRNKPLRSRPEGDATGNGHLGSIMEYTLCK